MNILKTQLIHHFLSKWFLSEDIARLFTVQRLNIQHICCCCCLVPKSCSTVLWPMDCSLPGSSPWDSPGKNTGVGCHFLLQGVFPTQGLNPHLSMFPALSDSFFTIELPGKPIQYIVDLNPNWILRCNILKAEANKSILLFTEVFLRRLCGKEERSWDLVLLDLAWILLAVLT